jgi:DNA (cytosine-5)-methyltransferase 1
MDYGSVCSGIEAATVAWHGLGWRAAWLSEIESFPSALLAHHYPDVPNLGDMTKIARKVLIGEVAAPGVLVGGTPCQAFSVAGLREGLSDERGQLTLSYVRLLDAIDYVRGRAGDRPAVAVWENVPGVLSSKDNAFGCFLGALSGEDEELQPPGKKWANAGCVFGPARTIAWRVLDAQYFGVAQRRRRVFVIASARKDFNPADVLFEFDGVRRDFAPSREAGQETAGTLASRTGAGGFPGTDEACSGYLQAFGGKQH